MSAPDNIDPNESMCYSEEFALGLLGDAADSARALLATLPVANARALEKYPIVALAYALLVHLDYRANEQYSHGEAIVEGLQAIRKSVDILAAKPHSDIPSNKTESASQALSDHARLKELMELARPVFSDAQYEEAVVRLRRLAGA